MAREDLGLKTCVAYGPDTGQGGQSLLQSGSWRVARWRVTSTDDGVCVPWISLSHVKRGIRKHLFDLGHKVVYLRAFARNGCREGPDAVPIFPLYRRVFLAARKNALLLADELPGGRKA